MRDESTAYEFEDLGSVMLWGLSQSSKVDLKNWLWQLKQEEWQLSSEDEFKPFGDTNNSRKTVYFYLFCVCICHCLLIWCFLYFPLYLYLAKGKTAESEWQLLKLRAGRSWKTCSAMYLYLCFYLWMCLYICLCLYLQMYLYMYWSCRRERQLARHVKSQPARPWKTCTAVYLYLPMNMYLYLPLYLYLGIGKDSRVRVAAP